jgi:hypothetical protein
MEGFKPEKNKNPWAEGLKAASLAAGLSAFPMVENPADAQTRPHANTENIHESRAERIRESKGTVSVASVVEYDHRLLNQEFPGNYRYLNFSIVLDDEGVVDTVGMDLPQNSETPFQKGERVTIKYRRLEGPYNSFIIEELRTEDGRVFGSEYFSYG